MATNGSIVQEKMDKYLDGNVKGVLVSKIDLNGKIMVDYTCPSCSKKGGKWLHTTIMQTSGGKASCEKSGNTYWITV
jgi:hypothetical protein